MSKILRFWTKTFNCPGSFRYSAVFFDSSMTYLNSFSALRYSNVCCSNTWDSFRKVRGGFLFVDSF